MMLRFDAVMPLMFAAIYGAARDATLLRLMLQEALP